VVFFFKETQPKRHGNNFTRNNRSIVDFYFFSGLHTTPCIALFPPISLSYQV